MALDDINKDNSGVGLQRYWKDLFPERLTKLYVYKGVNQKHRGKEIFSREDDISIISLELIDTIDGIFGGSNYAVGPLTVEEEKTIKEIELNNVPTKGFTAFLSDISHDYEDNNLFFTYGAPFQQGDINIENFNVYVANTSPNIFAQHVKGLSDTSSIDVSDLNKTTIAYVLTPAVLQNNLQSSKVVFADASTYHVLPTKEKDFEITSVTVRSDHSFAPEFGNWFFAKGDIELNNGQNEEIDIDFKADKPLLPARIKPYGKSNKVQFAIDNFNKFITMPWLYAKKFLSDNREIDGYILQGSTEQWALDLVQAVVNMFKMSHGFSTGFSEYRDANGEILNDQIGGVAVKSLEGKEKETATYVTQVLKNWEYENPSKTKTEEYLRARQILTASGLWVISDYSLGAQLSEFNKTLLDFYLRLDSAINKNTVTINMTLMSNKYNFGYEQKVDPTDPNNQIDDTTKPKITGLKGTSTESNIEIYETDRYSSQPELDDPISLIDFSSFPKDYKIDSPSSLKYIVGLDITDPNEIERFLIDQETSGEVIEEVTKAIDTGWAAPNSIDWLRKGRQYNFKLDSSQNVGGINLIPVNFVATSHDSSSPGTIPNADEELIRNGLSLPSNAYDITIKSVGARVDGVIDFRFTTGNVDVSALHQARKYFVESSYNTYRLEGAVVSYKIKTTSHGVKDKKFTYDKGTFFNLQNVYSSEQLFTRTLEISDDYRDNLGVPTVKIKSINRIWLSFFLGNYVDIKINYKYKDAQDVEVIGASLIPRLTLPSKHDERRTKFGIRI